MLQCIGVRYYSRRRCDIENARSEKIRDHIAGHEIARHYSAADTHFKKRSLDFCTDLVFSTLRSKKEDTKLITVTLPILNRFFLIFHSRLVVRKFTVKW